MAYNFAQAANSPGQSSRRSSEFHPRYSADDATLLLISSDGVKFKVHTFIVKMASEVFQNMLAQAIDTGEAVPLQERSDTLTLLLDSIYPNGAYLDLGSASFDTIWNFIIAAEKYDFTKIVDEFRIRVTSDMYFSKHPLEAFVIATRFNWKDAAEARILDTIDELSKPESFKLLALMDTEKILKLQKFADMRKRALLRMVNDMVSDHFFYEMQVEEWDGSQNEVANFTVRALAAEYLNKSPSGRELREVLDSKHVRKLVGDTWNLPYDRRLERVVEDLPVSVDDVKLDVVD